MARKFPWALGEVRRWNELASLQAEIKPTPQTAAMFKNMSRDPSSWDFDLKKICLGAMVKFGEHVLARIRRGVLEGARKLKRISDITAAIRKGSNSAGRPPLVDTGSFIRSFRLDTDFASASLFIGPARKYARLFYNLENGVNIAVTAQMRKYFWAQFFAAEESRDGRREEAFFRLATMSAGVIIIPARPFFTRALDAALANPDNNWGAAMAVDLGNAWVLAKGTRKHEADVIIRPQTQEPGE